MYQKIVDENPYENPMMIYPAVHYTMGGLWVDYELMSTVPGLFVAGEANFSDHGANRLGASALMQGLADGYFVLPYTIQNYLADQINVPRFKTDLPEFEESEKQVKARLQKLFDVKGTKPVDHFHRQLGKIMWEYVGMARNKEGLQKAISMIREVKAEFWKNVKITGENNEVNPELEKAGRVADFIELGELMAIDALNREESCGGHFREEYQTPEGEALRNDEEYMYVSAWEYSGDDKDPKLNTEPLEYEAIEVKQRNYK
jgi:succinate dehydrogenase / fumarate reductase flavoprotein subunit